MIKLTINGLPVSVEKGSTILEAARFYGFQYLRYVTKKDSRLTGHAGFVLWRSARALGLGSCHHAHILLKKA